MAKLALERKRAPIAWIDFIEPQHSHHSCTTVAYLFLQPRDDSQVSNLRGLAETSIIVQSRLGEMLGPERKKRAQFFFPRKEILLTYKEILASKKYGWILG